MSKIAIYGHGYVGQGMQRLFPDAVIYDPPKGFHDSPRARKYVDLVIICVPTPQTADGSCDTSIVESLMDDIPPKIPVLIKSTVPPGTTERLRKEYDRRLVFSPEYMGEGGYWVPPEFPDPHNSISHRFMILGGTVDDCTEIADIFAKIMGPATRFRFMRSREAETVKYFENAFLGLKVVFANEMRRFCEEQEIAYYAVREGWLDDPRVGESHSLAFKGSRGFDGKCLPKDIAALRAVFKSPLLDGIVAANEKNRA